ncbi:hypothetical protein E3P86_01356 [Wallemia ichthyophaga]|uniref:Uncharacterized protein n=1 Tax=Wallemia ichthyophaga TaxID=245174 RepID=A0A4T0J7Z3_WALIC|nr:hypothetical protein E3P86_01356 [Wallemia ichthyophaga]
MSTYARPTYTGSPSWQANDFFNAHSRSLGLSRERYPHSRFSELFAVIRNHERAERALRRTLQILRIGGSHIEEAQLAHSKYYYMGCIEAPYSSRELAAAAGYQAFLVWENHHLVLMPSFVPGLKEVLEWIAGIAIAESCKLCEELAFTNEKEIREACEWAAKTAQIAYEETHSRIGRIRRHSVGNQRQHQEFYNSRYLPGQPDTVYGGYQGYPAGYGSYPEEFGPAYMGDYYGGYGMPMPQHYGGMSGMGGGMASGMPGMGSMGNMGMGTGTGMNGMMPNMGMNGMSNMNGMNGMNGMGIPQSSSILIHLAQAARVSVERIHVEFVIEVVHNNPRQLALAFNTTEDATFPHSTGDELEGISGYFVGHWRKTDDDALAPPLMAGFEGGSHHADVSNTYDSVVETASSDINQVRFDGPVDVKGIYKVCCAVFQGVLLFVAVGIYCNDPARSRRFRPLYSGQTYAAGAEDSDRLALHLLLSSSAVAGSYAAAEQASFL